MILCAITDRKQLGNDESERGAKLAEIVSRWAASGVDLIQIREKDLTTSDLIPLLERVTQVVRHAGRSTKILVNAKPEAAVAVALAGGVDGIHLPGGLNPNQLIDAIREIREDLSAAAAVSVSCHSVEEVAAARAAGASLALFAPVFGKPLAGSRSLPGSGLEALAEACVAAGEGDSAPAMPVLALGGVTVFNAPRCVAVGAGGVAGIRLFLGDEWKQLAVGKGERP